MVRRGYHFTEPVAIRYVEDAGLNAARVLDGLVVVISPATNHYIYLVADIQSAMRREGLKELPEIMPYLTGQQKWKHGDGPGRKQKKPKPPAKKKGRPSTRIEIF
jgi:hypothetical protein